MEIWLTSDTHFSHDKEFLYGPRGFTNVKDMNMAIVENWNSVVKPDDEVWHLGDMALGDIDDACKYINQLNGTIRWIQGNHCTEKKIGKIIEECPAVWEIGWAYQIKIGKHSIYMSHYPTLTANFDDKHFSQHVIALHGHTHQQTNWLQLTNPFTYHVGMDSHNCTPVHIDEVIADIKNRWNELGNNTNMLKVPDAYGIPGGGKL